MNMTLELLDGYVFARCSVCEEPICLKVAESAPVWETSNPQPHHSARLCAVRLSTMRYGPGLNHIPEFV